ncbi:hypothetical protein [Photobacterium lipolyticum]|uniref:Uncharacterized protein n=1 Tax=Photobacterium lipolyticum TaxID=266810 RepID=A0A2T3N1A1_9GAMM|nr:hypothetical protein [Photobacterium lipolyticum]PSW06076.1 hypothetical protein C9I89_06065 [Photobacterium lipolyticum]
MSAKTPLFTYLCRKVENEFPHIPNRSIPDVIAWALEFKSYASLNAAYQRNDIDLDNPDVVQKLLRKWNDDEPNDTHADYSLLEKLISKNKSPAIVNLNVENLILCLNMMLIVYHPEVLNCDGCQKEMTTTVDDFEFVTEAEDEDDVYAVLCSDCLAKELAKPHSEKTIYAIDRSYRHV